MVPNNPKRTLARSVGVLLVATLVLSAGVSSALAAGSNASARMDNDQQTSDLTIDGLDVAIEDVHLSGEGLPNVAIENHTYTIDERSVTVDGGTISVGGAEVGFDDLTVAIEDSSMSVRNVSVGD